MAAFYAVFNQISGLFLGVFKNGLTIRDDAIRAKKIRKGSQILFCFINAGVDTVFRV